MRTIKQVKTILSVFLCLIITIFSFTSIVSAEELTNEYDTEETTAMSDEEILISNEELFAAIEEEYSKLEQDIENNKEELNNINNDINDNVQRLAIINSEVDILNNQIKLLNSELDSLSFSLDIINRVSEELKLKQEELTVSIKEAEEAIDVLEPELKKATDEVQELIKNEYMYGEISFAEIVFTSTSMQEYFTRKELYRRLKDDREQKMNDVINLNNTIKEYKDELEKDKKTIENDINIINNYQDKYNESLKKQEEAQNELINKKTDITDKKNEIKDIISTLDTESEVYKEQIRKDREEMEILSIYVDNYISEYGSKLNDIPSEEFENNGQMIWPVTFPSYLSAKFPAYSDGTPHWGIDICANGGNSAGRPFNAAQSGIVIIAVNDNNYNNGFGNYCVVDHGDGTSTLYAHVRNLVVDKGDVVRQGETLGYIGNTGNTTGPHLHFEVRVKKEDGTVARVNPLNFVENIT